MQADAIALRRGRAHIRAMRILDIDDSAPPDAARLSPCLVDGETVLIAFGSPTGSILFTERRLILSQREHLLEERMETTSYPWREVRRFAVQEGTQRLVLRIWLGEDDHPLQLRAGAQTDLGPLQRLLAQRMG
jgi:hypothetical protein